MRDEITRLADIADRLDRAHALLELSQEQSSLEAMASKVDYASSALLGAQAALTELRALARTAHAEDKLGMVPEGWGIEAQVVGYRWRNSDHQPWTLGETVSGFDLNSREIGAAIEPLGVVNQQLTAGDVARADLVPGVMHCAKCKFRVHRTTLYMGSGTTGPGDNKTEPCPNGCGPLWPVTWEQEAREAMALANGLHEQLQAAQQQGEEKIACDVKVAPATTFRAGVSLSTVVRAIRSRAEWAAKEGDGPYVFLGKTDHIEDKLGMVPASRDRVSEIEDAVASGAMNAMQCFTQMRQLIVKPDHSAGVGGVVAHLIRPAGFNESANVTVMTHTVQPGNVEAWRFGEARAMSMPGGDYIDGGLSLLKELHLRGYGIVRVAALAQPADADAEGGK